MSEHFNGLTPAEDERLACLIEECSEVIKCCTKIMRHGYDSVNLKEPGSPTNRDHLALELADVYRTAFLMITRGDVSEDIISDSVANKKWGAFAHHNTQDGSDV